MLYRKRLSLKAPALSKVKYKSIFSWGWPSFLFLQALVLYGFGEPKAQHPGLKDFFKLLTCLLVFVGTPLNEESLSGLAQRRGLGSRRFEQVPLLCQPNPIPSGYIYINTASFLIQFNNYSYLANHCLKDTHPSLWRFYLHTHQRCKYLLQQIAPTDIIMLYSSSPIIIWGGPDQSRVDRVAPFP